MHGRAGPPCTRQRPQCHPPSPQPCAHSVPPPPHSCVATNGVGAGSQARDPQSRTPNPSLHLSTWQAELSAGGGLSRAHQRCRVRGRKAGLRPVLPRILPRCSGPLTGGHQLPAQLCASAHASPGTEDGLHIHMPTAGSRAPCQVERAASRITGQLGYSQASYPAGLAGWARSRRRRMRRRSVAGEMCCSHTRRRIWVDWCP